MARDPVTDAEIEDAQTAILEQRDEIREFLESEGVDVEEDTVRDDPVTDADRDPADSD